MFLRLLIPIFFFNSSNLTFFKGLVTISASCNYDLQYASSSFPLLTWSLKKWHLLYMCLLQPWHTWWFSISITDLLSKNNLIFLGSMILSSLSNISIHVVWLAAYDATMYSNSQDDKTTMLCFLEIKEIGAPQIMNM